MKLSYYLIGLLLLLVFLSISIGTSDFSWGKLFDFDQQTWLLFQESRLPRTISILLTASSMSMAGLLMQTITQNQFAAPSTVGTTEAAKLGMVLSLFVFPSASLTQKMLFAFVSSIVFTLFFLAFMTIFTVKERWMLPLIGIIYSGIIGSVTEVIAYRFNLVGFISLTLGQALIERVFTLEIRISMIIESVGGLLFFILLYRRARQ